jgi:hypothetical protein
VVGFVETDGALGTLVTANITDWKLTLTAPNLLDGPINVIDFAAHIQSSVMGNALTATPTQLLFNFDSPGDAFFFHAGEVTERQLLVRPNETVRSRFPHRVNRQA